METFGLESDRESTELEQWRPVVGYEGAYSVSDLGRVRRDSSGKGARPGHILSATVLQGPGYLRVALLRNGKQVTRTVHSLVAESFIGPANGLCVNHKDGNKLNNLPGNLEYVTLAENNLHAHAIGLHPPRVIACRYGHPYDESNTVVRRNGARDCRQCLRRRNRNYKKRLAVTRPLGR